MQLNKKQIKGLLNVMSSNSHRPAIAQACVNTAADGKTYLTVTDGYHLASIYAPDLSDCVGLAIPRDEMIKWYKLAVGKTVFNDDTVRELAKDTGHKYPDWSVLLPRGDEEKPLPTAYFNADYMSNLQQVNGDPLLYRFYRDIHSPAVARNEGNIYIIMQLKG